MLLSSCAQTSSTGNSGSVFTSGTYEQGFKAGHNDAVYKSTRDPHRALLEANNPSVNSFEDGYVAGFDGAAKSR